MHRLRVLLLERETLMDDKYIRNSDTHLRDCVCYEMWDYVRLKFNYIKIGNVRI